MILKRTYYITLLIVFSTLLFAKENVQIAWEKQQAAVRYILQLSDDISFRNIAYQTQTRQTMVTIPFRKSYKYGRVAAIDKNGVTGFFSEPFQVEKMVLNRVVENETIQPIPPKKDPIIYVPLENQIQVYSSDNLNQIKNRVFRIGSGKWMPYRSPIHLNKAGHYTIYYYSTDTIGNKEKIRSKTYIVDADGPKIDSKWHHSVEKGDFWHIGKNSMISIQAQDAESGLKTLHASVFRKQKKQLLPIKDNRIELGQINMDYGIIQLLGEDQVGNQTRILAKFIKDTAPPQIYLTPNLSQQTYYPINTKFSIAIQDNGSGPAKIQYSLDGQNYKDYSGEIVFNQAGQYQLYVKAYDLLGNENMLTTRQFMIMNGDVNSQIRIQK